MCIKHLFFFAIIKKMCIFAGLNALREAFAPKKF